MTAHLNASWSQICRNCTPGFEGLVDDINYYEEDYYDYNINTSNFYYLCIMNLNPYYFSFPNQDTYSETAAFAYGLSAIIKSLVGFILNLLVILAIIRSSDLRKEYLTPSILSIAMADFILSAYVLPKMAFIVFARADTSPSVCVLDAYLGVGLWSMSAINLFGIAALRFIAVYFPTITKTKAFQLSCMIVPAMCWVVSLPIFFMTMAINIFVQMIFVIGILILFLNVGIFLQISKQSRKIFEQIKDTSMETAMKILEKEKKMGKMTGIITLSFCMIYGPITVLYLINPDAPLNNPTAVLVTESITTFLVIIDPMVYIIWHEKYRDGIKDLFKCSNSGFHNTSL
jgi:hypothetical protein